MKTKVSARARLARPVRVMRMLVRCMVLSVLASTGARAAHMDTDSDVSIRWDNTIKYSDAFRVRSQDPYILSNVNADDGDRNFNTGLISNRLDILSEFDLSYHKYGVSISAAGWYDSVYNRHSDGNSPGTFNPISVPPNTFTAATRRIDGRDAEILNAFVYGQEQIGDKTLSFRAGRHTLLWGESLLIPTNGIAFGQAPIDVIKLLSVPNTLAKELFLPVSQISGQLQFTGSFSIAAYEQLEWRKTRLPGSGSYFSFIDSADYGGERQLLPGGLSLYRTRDSRPSGFDQFGIALRYASAALGTDFGLYYVNYNDKMPQVGAYIAPNFAIGQLGNYYLLYPTNVHMLGFSVSTSAGPVNVGGEVSVRIHEPLVSVPQVSPTYVDSGNTTGAIGKSFHAQVSALYLLSPNAIWQGGSFAGEIACNTRLSITRNPGALDPTTTRSAEGLRFIFSPQWYQVYPGVDLTAPLGVGYNPRGNSSVVQVFNGGAFKGGDATLGITLDIKTVWHAGVTYTQYYGSAPNQIFYDRSFAALSLQRTF
jgi:hypothetical protein